MMSKEKRRVPKLRFPGFTEDWEQRKLGDFYTFKNGLNKEKVYFGYGDSIVNFTDVFHNRQIYSSTLKGKVCVNKKELENYKVKEGDLFFTRTSETIDEIGFPAVVMEPMERVVFSGFVLRGRAEKNDPLVNIFKSYIFFTDNFRSEMKKKSSMTTRALTSGTALKEMYFSYPKDLEEQTKIGEILLRLDNIITIHQRKLEKLKLAKKALLQKLFPKNGSQFPEIRFKGFTDAWEQRKLGDIATITGGGTPSTNISEYWNGDIDWYSPVEIGEKRYASGSIRKITKLGLEKSSAKILPVGTVLFTSRAGIGNTAILQVEGCTNQGFQSITPNSKELDTYFLYTMTPKLKRYGEVTGAGSTFVEVSGKQMEQMNLRIPSLEEQKHVSQFFKVMDDAITLHQRKLDHLQLQKKALLQQMFV